MILTKRSLLAAGLTGWATLAAIRAIQKFAKRQGNALPSTPLHALEDERIHVPSRSSTI